MFPYVFVRRFNDVTEIQPGDEAPNHFSYTSRDEDYVKDQVPCWLTYTNGTSHEIIQNNLHRAPMFTGVVKGVGPRYCPSIEDKIVRFADRNATNSSLEPEGRNTEEVYVQASQPVCLRMFSVTWFIPLKVWKMQR